MYPGNDSSSRSRIVRNSRSIQPLSDPRYGLADCTLIRRYSHAAMNATG